MERFTLKIFNKPKSSVRNVCRLCGMDNPNKVFILRDDDVFCEDDVPLSTKIQVCCGIEVTKKDRMPQKICPLCSDKINDFYEFREMCTATNVQTRDLLGLPKEKPKPKLQPPPFLAPLSRAQTTQNHIERQDTPSRTILQPPIISESKTMRDTTPQRRPVGRPTRGQKVAKKKTTGKVIKNTRGAKAMNTRKKEQLTRAAKLVNLKQEPKDPPPPPPPKPTPVVDIKPLLKPAVVKLTNILPIPPSPSLSQPKPGPASKTKPKKRVQFAPPLPVEEKRPSLEELEKPRPKKARVEKPPKPPVQIKCQICTESVDKSCYSKHMMKIHTPKTFEYGCSPCGVPFETLKDYRDHQNWHRDDKIPFRCFKCLRVFEKLASYIVHSQKFCTGNHNFTNTVPNINCTMCGMEFVTFNLYNWHDCFIKSNTNCPKCDRFIQRKDRLFKHIFVCRGKGTTGISPEVPEDVNSGEMEKLGTLVPKVKPLKIKIHKRTFSTVAGGSRVETVIKTEPDSTLEIEESQVNIEGASLHTSYEDIQPPKAKPKSPKSPKKKMTLKNPYARLAKRIKQEPKEPTEVAQQVPRTPQQVSKSLVRVKQEPVDSGYEKIVRIAAKNIKKERIDPTEEPPQEENEAEMETETPQEEDETPLEEEPPQADDQSEEEEEAEPERPPPPPPLPRGVRIKQEKPDHVIVKPERIDPAYDKHLPPKPPAKVQKVAKKRVFKIPTALILKLQQEKKQQEKEAQPETQSNHEEQQTDTVGQAQVNDEQPEQPEAPQEAPEVPEVAPEAPEAAPEAEPAPQTPQATVPVITGVMSIEKSAFRAPFVPVRIKTERMSPTRTLHRDENTAQEENGVNGSSAHEEDKDADGETTTDEEAATDATENEKNTEVAEEETTLEVPKEIPEQNAAEPEKPAEPEENLPVSISTNDQNGVSHEIPMSIEESEATEASQAEQNV